MWVSNERSFRASGPCRHGALVPRSDVVRYARPGVQRQWIRVAALVALMSALASPASAAADWSNAQTVTVTTSEYHFAPDKLVFRHGVPYRLHIENHGKDLHEFTAPEFFKAVELRDGAPLNADKIEIEIPPGTSKDLYFLAHRSGRYPLRCSDHDWAGMKGKITVE